MTDPILGILTGVAAAAPVCLLLFYMLHRWATHTGEVFQAGQQARYDARMAKAAFNSAETRRDLDKLYWRGFRDGLRDGANALTVCAERLAVHHGCDVAQLEEAAQALNSRADNAPYGGDDGSGYEEAGHVSPQQHERPDQQGQEQGDERE